MSDSPVVLFSTLTERATFLTDVLSRLHTYALREYVAEHSSALDFLYGAVPMPDKDTLIRDVNLLHTDFLNHGPLAVFWNDFCEATAMAGVTDGMQICGKPGRGIVARRRQAYVSTAQTFWLSYWNTYKIV